MSYIRSTQNPEKLYIWGDETNATISEGGLPNWNIPLKTFEGLLKKFHKNFHEMPCNYKGCVVDEIYADETYKVVLSYGNNKAIMYDVTWEYIVLSYIVRN